MNALKIYLQPASLRMLALGFSAGLPLLLVLGTLSFWLREAGVSRAAIGHLSWVGLAYGFKWLWAPLVDRITLPLLGRLGRRRSWLLVAQVGVMAGLVGMAMSDPKESLNAIVWCALLVAFSSATQDIALDAFRIESAGTDQQAALAASYQTGYRLAMIWAGAGVLWIAARSEAPSAAAYAQAPWGVAYSVMALSMLVGVLTVLFSKEPAPIHSHVRATNVREWLHIALINPFADFCERYGWQAFLILALIATYRISDVVMGIMANPFYVDMGYTKDEVAAVTKVFGVVMTLLGAFIGGALAPKIGVMRLMMAGAVLSSLTNLLFVWLGSRGHDVNALIAVVSADNLASGIASAAFIAYLSSLTNINYTATQYALFSSLMLLLPKFLAGFSGEFVDAQGYANFFTATALLGLPVLMLVWWAARLQSRPNGLE
ncbi:MAG: MFS transporter [Cytophagales bacterium]|nr:MFS transporter [Cytophagales bacterium]